MRILLLICAFFPLLFSSCGVGGKAHRVWSERFSLTGKAVAERAGSEVHYVIHPDRDFRENPWFSWPEGYPECKLDSAVTYRFELIENVNHVDDRSAYRDVTVEKIFSPEGKTVFDASFCPIHQQKMHWDWEVSGSKEDYWKTPFFKWRAQRFPHDGYAYLACGSGYYTKRRWICPKCERASGEAVKKLGIKRY